MVGLLGIKVGGVKRRVIDRRRVVPITHASGDHGVPRPRPTTSHSASPA